MNLIPFEYHGIELRESCVIKGTPYFTRRAIGEWLEYPNPQNAIDIIIKRNPHISDSRWSVGVKLTSTDGKNYEHEVYDPVGLQLIVFESRQPKAVQYKIAVARLVADMLSGEYDRLMFIQSTEELKAYNAYKKSLTKKQRSGSCKRKPINNTSMNL